jgi:cytosine/adenosine deaminase-related metal-dependent hydrolase
MNFYKAPRTSRAEEICQCTSISPKRNPKVMGKRLYGTSLLQHLASLDILRPNLSLAHSVWIEPADIELFATTGATPVHSPASNLRLAAGWRRFVNFYLEVLI